MQIISIDDADFSALLAHMQEASPIGRFWRNGKVQLVRASPRFMLISPADEPKRIAIKPARSLNEAQNLAKQFLKREAERGGQIEEGA